MLKLEKNLLPDVAEEDSANPPLDAKASDRIFYNVHVHGVIPSGSNICADSGKICLFVIVGVSVSAVLKINVYQDSISLKLYNFQS